MPKASRTDENKEAAPPRRRWRRRLLWTAGILVLVVLLAPLALALGPVRDMVAGQIGDRLGRRVQIDSAFAFWGKGIDLEGITVHSPAGFDGPLATVRRIHADLDVLSLLSGPLSASVRVVEPHVTFRRNARDEGNADGLLEAQEAEERPPTRHEDGQPVRLGLVVLGGTVEAVSLASGAGGKIDDIQVTLDLDGTGATALSFGAVAVGAAKDGGDARIRADARLDRDGAGPVAFEAPPIELSRLAAVLETVLGVAQVGGEVAASAKGTLRADGSLEGAFELGGTNLRGTFGGSRLSLERLRARAEVAGQEGAPDSVAQIDLSAAGLRLEPGSGPDRNELREPEVNLKAVLRYDPASGAATVTSAHLHAGATASIEVPEPLRIETKPRASFAGRVQARVDLGRLGRFRGFAPAVASLESGVLEGYVAGHSAEELNADAGLTVKDLRIGPGELAPEGYEERLVNVGVSALRDAQGHTTITLREIQSALLRTFARPDQAPLQAKVDTEGRVGLDGAFDLGVDLPALSRLLGRSLGLAPGEQFTGTLRLAGTAAGTAERMTVRATVAATDLRPPASWGRTRRPSTLQAVLTAESTPERLELRVSECLGLGLSAVSARANLARGDDEAKPAEVDLAFQVDLAGARPWIGHPLGLAAGEHLAGRLGTELKVSGGAAGRKLSCRAQVDDLIWQTGTATPPLRRARVLLEARGELAEAGGRHRMETLKLTTEGLSLDLGGSSAVVEPDVDLDGTLRLGGDAAQLAPLLSAMLGEGYEDLRGQGALSGAVTLRGSPADNARGLLVEGSLDLGAWNTGGIQTSPVKVRLARPAAAAPLSATLATVLNGGPSTVSAALTLGGKAIPWRGTVGVKGADTSGVLVSRGPGRYLAFALPALLPAGAQQPVLSGRLDADLSASSPSLSAPALQDGLVANGSVQMTQGEIRQSTLFGGGGDSSLGKLVSALRVAAPEAGAVLGEASKAVTFTSLDSRFRIANRVVNVERVDLKGRRLDVAMTGRVDFEQRCALRATVTLTGSGGQALAKVLPGGAIPMGIGGTLTQPRVAPDVDLKKLIGNPLERVPDLLDGLKKKKPKLPDIFK